MLYCLRIMLFNCVARSCLQVRVLLIVCPSHALFFIERLLVVVFGRKHFRLNVELWFSHCKHVCIALCPNCWMAYFIRVDAANEAVHELIVEPVQEPRAEEQQQVAVEPAPEDFVNPADLQGKPRSITII